MMKARWLAVVLFVLSCATDPGDAQKNADKWGKAMGIEGPVVCSDQDSDSDDWVSCTFKDKQGVQAIECATGRGCTKGGCRVPKLRAAQGQTTP